MTTEPPQFAIVPEADDLAAIDRELRFFPCANPHPQTLTAGQVEAFNRDGYLFPFDVFSAEEIDGHRRYFDQLLQQEMGRGGDSYSISSAHLRYPEVHDLLCEPRIVSRVADLLGGHVIGWGSHYFCKMPGDGKSVSWHQDASYWPLTPSKTITVWLAIDDADEENACMQFIRGSHLGGHLPFADSSDSEQNVLNQTVDVSSYDAPVPVVLRAGQVSLHSDLLLHGSLANRSRRRRCGLTLRYCAADVVAHLGWHRKGVSVRGSAPPHWRS